MLGDEREVLGKYRLLAKLGEGGMANVHLAVASGPVGFHKLLVVKQVRTALLEEPDVLEMFFDEARLAARLNHPNVVQTLEVNATPDGWPFIAMEYLDGQPFHRILGRLGVGPTRYGNLPLYVRTIAEACEGLHYAHELSDYNGAPLNIVHRDVSPHNIFVTYEGQVKLVDFGVAKAVTSAAMTRTGALKGKVPYMAPEQATGAEVDRRADLFAMGVVLWNVLSDTRLWQGLSELTVLQNLVNGRIPSADEALPSAPPELRVVVNKALAFRPRDRYQTAAEMRRDLEKYLQGTGASLSPREVGDYIATYFSEERSALRAVIDARLREASSQAPVGEPMGTPMSRPLTRGGAPVESGVSFGSGMTPSGHGAVISGWQGPAQAHLHPTMSQFSQMAQPPAASYPPTLQGAANLTAPMSQAAPGSRVMVPGALLLGAALVASTLWFALRGPGPLPNPTATTATNGEKVEATTPPAAPAAAGPVTLEIEATPGEARLFLDGKPLDKNPFSGSFERDDRVHVLRAEAKGFVSREREVVMQRDLRVQFALEREHDHDRPGSGHARPRPPPPPVTGGTAKPNVRQVDDDNPYKKNP